MSDSDLLGGFARRELLRPSDVNALVRSALQGAFPEEIWVAGEISNYTRAASGHRYFTLKDERSQVRAVMFRGAGQYLRFEPENGMAVHARAVITVYEPRGEYQLSVTLLEPAGVGALQAAFEQLKARLEAEGLFDPASKRPLPALPRRIGIVTSPRGAAIRDILTVLQRRHPNIQVTIYPTLVQGAEAPAQISAGVEALDATGAFDVIVLTRGGGSMEDLWAFNDERVARALAACSTPTISAVGHEVDFTIADFVADVRAPTPSAAAEMVIAREDELRESVSALGRRMARAVEGQVRQQRARLSAASPRRLAAWVRSLYQRASQSADESGRALRRAAAALAGGGRANLTALAGRLEALSPLRALGRGYCIATRAGQSRPLLSAAELRIGEELRLRLAAGRIGCEVKEIDEEETVA